MALTQEQIDFFHEQGYLPYGPILDESEIEELRDEYDEVFRRAQHDNKLRNLSAGGEEGSEEQQQMLQIMQMCERNIIFRRLLYHERILDIAQDLMGPNIMLFHDQALYKPALTGGPITWHQDNAYWKCTPANLISCWLTLDDVVRENGAMQVVPGSHLKPAHHVPTGGILIETDTGGAEPTVVELPAGGCMFHHCQTLHSTDPNATERQRRAFAIHFMPPGTRRREGEIMRASFSHPVLRMNM